MSGFTTETICALAREAGAGLSCIAEPLEHPWKFSQTELERFAALVKQEAVQEIAANCAKRGITFCTDRMSVALASPRVAIPAGLSAEEIRRHIISAGVQTEATK